jgi:hypothetical protein
MYATVKDAPVVIIVLVVLCQDINCSISTDCRINYVTICARPV